jgi:hypothetical protein
MLRSVGAGLLLSSLLQAVNDILMPAAMSSAIITDNNFLVFIVF